MSHRREFLALLAGSPLLGGLPGLARALATSEPPIEAVVKSAADALNVFVATAQDSVLREPNRAP